jgi:hypothetical protein
MQRMWVVLAAVVLSACADDVPVVKWSKPGASYDQFVLDRTACVKETRENSRPFILGGQRYGGSAYALDGGLFQSCMTERGYARDQNGYAAPSGDEIPLGP